MDGPNARVSRAIFIPSTRRSSSLHKASSPSTSARVAPAIARRCDGIRDYIVAHYRMNERTDSDCWRNNAVNRNLSNNLEAVMTVWFTGADLAKEVAKLDIRRYYS